MKKLFLSLIILFSCPFLAAEDPASKVIETANTEEMIPSLDLEDDALILEERAEEYEKWVSIYKEMITLDHTYKEIFPLAHRSYRAVFYREQIFRYEALAKEVRKVADLLAKTQDTLQLEKAIISFNAQADSFEDRAEQLEQMAQTASSESEEGDLELQVRGYLNLAFDYREVAWDIREILANSN